MAMGVRSPIIDGQKQCSACKEWLDTDNYKKKATGTFLSACNTCRKEYSRAYRRGRPKPTYRNTQVIIDDKKECRGCQQWLPVNHFKRVSKSATTLHAQCRECNNRAERERRSSKRGVMADEPTLRNMHNKICVSCLQIVSEEQLLPLLRNFHGRMVTQASCISCRAAKDNTPWAATCSEKEKMQIPVWHDDIGCNYQPSCLGCQLPVCVDDLTPGQRLHFHRWWNTHLFLQHLHKMRNEGRKVKDIAAELGVTERTVYGRLSKPLETIEQAMGIDT